MTAVPEFLRRCDGIEVHDAQDGLVIFFPETQRVHHLNQTAAVLFELCDGTRATSDLPKLVADLFQLDATPVEEVRAGVQQLMDESILVAVESEVPAETD